MASQGNNEQLPGVGLTVIAEPESMAEIAEAFCKIMPPTVGAVRAASDIATLQRHAAEALDEGGNGAIVIVDTAVDVTTEIPDEVSSAPAALRELQKGEGSPIVLVTTRRIGDTALLDSLQRKRAGEDGTDTPAREGFDAIIHAGTDGEVVAIDEALRRLAADMPRIVGRTACTAAA